MESFSKESIERLRGLGGQTFVNKMIDLFLGFTDEKLREAERALSVGQFEAIGKAAHAIKSSAGNVGAVRVQHLAEDLEEQIRRGQDEEAAERVKVLREAVEEVIPLLEACRQSADASGGSAG